MRINIKPLFWITTLVSICPGSVISSTYCTNVPPAEYRLVAPPVNLDGSSFPLLAKYLPHIGFTMYVWDDTLPTWSPAPPSFFPGEGAIVRRAASGGTGRLCFYGSSSIPALPLQLAPGFNLVCCQSDRVARFEEIVGRSPENGSQLYKFNSGPGRDPSHLSPPDYTVYTFTNGVWSPEIPTADIGEAVFVYQPPWLANPRIRDGKLEFEVKAPVGTIATVEYSESLTNASWKALSSVSGTANGVRVTDDMGLNTPAPRYYRVKISP